MGIRLGKARKTCRFMMEPLEQRELLSGATEIVAPVSDSLNPAPMPALAESLLPPSPTALTSTAVFSNFVELSWADGSSNEAGFRIERSVDGVEYVTAGTVSPNVCSFHDSNLSPDTPYFYRVQAFDDAGGASASEVINVTTQPQLLDAAFDANGLSKIAYNGTTLFDLAAYPEEGFRVAEYKIIKPDGTVVRHGIDYTPVSTFDSATHTLTYTFPWARINIQYVVDADRLGLNFTVTNRSSLNTLAGITMLPFSVRFPVFPAGYDAEEPHIAYNIDGPSVIPADWGSGMVVAANDDVTTPLYTGWLTSNVTAQTLRYEFWVGSTYLSYQPLNWSRFDRPIAPGGTDQYSLSLRFAPTGSSPAQLAYDVYAAAAAQYPFQVNWSDRRAIGVVHVSSPGPSISATNPRGYLHDPYINVLTKIGLSRFRRRLLSAADRSIAVLKSMNAQGMIVWDLEGSQYKRLGYVGDPRMLPTLAPEMESQLIIDQYFKKFRDAGLRVGVTIRGQHPLLTKSGWKQAESANVYKVLAAKIAYARTRWGATLFYIDSNAPLATSEVYDATIMRKLANKFPDVLLIPEHENTRYFGSTAPYAELRQGTTGTPESALEAYPGAFSVIYTGEVDPDAYHAQLVAAVRRGDILLFCGWFDDPQNPRVKSIYDEAFPPSP